MSLCTSQSDSEMEMCRVPARDVKEFWGGGLLSVIPILMDFATVSFWQGNRGLSHNPYFDHIIDLSCPEMPFCPPGCSWSTFYHACYFLFITDNQNKTKKEQKKVFFFFSKNEMELKNWMTSSYGPLSPCTALPKQNGRVAIVTGGTRGMGFETARHLARLGMHVIIGRLLSSQCSVQFPLIFIILF